jgi:hypothetical protein
MAKAKKKQLHHFNSKNKAHNNNTHATSACNKYKTKPKHKKKRKQRIPLAVRQAVWQSQFGETFKHKCYVSWCHRIISCFDFEVGHNIPESKGGTLNLDNLLPICHQCNIGMGNQYTIIDWSNRKFKME